MNQASYAGQDNVLAKCIAEIFHGY
jgi:hypothetical protein